MSGWVGVEGVVAVEMREVRIIEGELEVDGGV